MNNNTKTFCILPFVHVATHPNGAVTPCCDSSDYFPKNGDTILNLNTHTISEIRNSESFKELRESMKRGERHSACNYCWNQESAGLESRRERENESYGINDITYRYFEETMPLLNVELRLGNICNMKCLICHPHSSSKWNEDSLALKQSNFKFLYEESSLYDSHNINREWYRNESFYNQLIDVDSKLNHIWINGGEPTLIKEHYSFLEKLIESGKSNDITLDYNVNGSHIPDKLIDIWKKFKHVGVTISMDDIGDRIYYQRYPTKFDDVISTIRKLESRDVIYTIIPTISLYNVYNVVNIWKYIIDNLNGNLPALNFVYEPFHLTISNLPQVEKDKLIETWKSSDILFTHIIDKLIFNINRTPTHNIHVFRRFTEILDKKRNLNVLDYLPEYNWLFSNSNII